MQKEIEFWSRCFKQFQVIETLGGAETKTILDLETFEQENGFLLPSDYKSFCTVFGTCSFFQDRKVYCPSLSLSEQFLFPLNQELDSALDSNDSLEYVSPDMHENIKRFLTGAGLVFGDDVSAKIYLFDLESYQKEDKSCNIWSASGEGELGNFSFLGRSFYSFFFSSCIELDDEPLTMAETVISLSQEKQLLRRFNSSQLLMNF